MMLRLLLACLFACWASVSPAGTMLLMGTGKGAPVASVGATITTVCQGTNLTNNTTIACTGTSAVAAGETLIAAVTYSGNRTLVSFGDGTNAYTVGIEANGGPGSSFAYILNPAAVSNGATYTATISAANATKAIQVWKLSRTAAALISTGTAKASSTDPSCTTDGPITVNSAVFSVVSAQNPTTEATGIWVTPADQNILVGSGNYSIEQHGIATSTATVNYAVTITPAAFWTCLVIGVL